MSRHAKTALARKRNLALAAALAAIVGVVAATTAQGSPQSQATSAEKRDARFWRQLTSAFTPAKRMGLDAMADHLILRTAGGPVLALHFDNMNLAKAKNLNWVAYALPGKFTRSDQSRLNRLYGPGFTHFHSFKTDVHGGKVGAPGVWFVHIGTRDFRSPFGNVQSGKVDTKFMPTPPRG